MANANLISQKSHGLTRSTPSLPINMHLILHPCFRYADVKEVLAHISVKLGFVERAKTKIPYTFSYTAPNRYLSITTSPFRYDNNQLCYGFRYTLKKPSTQPANKVNKRPYALSAWHKHPLMLYFDLLQETQASTDDTPLDASEPWKLLQEHPLYLDILLGEDSFARTLSREERDLIIALDQHGYEFQTLTQVTSLAFWEVPPAFLDQLAVCGFTHFSTEELCSLWQKKIPLSYLGGFANHGYNHFSAEEYIAFYAREVDPASLGEFMEAS